MSRATNFDIRISRDVALYLLAHDCVDDAKVSIMCKEYGEDDDWVGVGNDDVEVMLDDESYQTFELWANTTIPEVNNVADA